MQYLLPCKCGQSIAVSRSQAGTTILCPECSTSLEIPTIRAMSKLEVVESGGNIDTTSAKPAAGAANSKAIVVERSLFRTSISALFFAVFIIAGITTARWAAIRFMNPTAFTVEDEIVEGEKILANFSPANTWDAWQFYQSAGFKEKNASSYFLVKRTLELQDEKMKVGALITAISFFGLIGAIFWPRSRKS